MLRAGVRLPNRFGVVVAPVVGFLLSYLFEYAKVAESADAHGLGPCPVRGGGSSPPFRTY